jgi:pimeloyl-ACP methyl ester carboxylesterase
MYQTYNKGAVTMEKPTIVLVHGAFADASGFAGVITELEAAGYDVVAPPNPLRGLVSDAESIATRVQAIKGPVVLVGHSYGGAVIGQASAGLDNVKALVFLAALVLDVGESGASVQAPFPAPLLASTNAPTSYDAPGATSGPDIYIKKADFHETFCADVPADTAEVMYVTQRPLALAALTENATAAGWKDLPTWFLVSDQDSAISPKAEEFMAERMKATTEHIDASHVAFMSRPKEVAAFIQKAVNAA